MSIYVTSLVWQHAPEELDQGSLLLLLALADFANDEGGNVFPSVATMAGKTRCSERSIQRRLRDLEDQGLLGIEKTATRHSTTHYRINIACFSEARQSVTSARAEVTSQAPGATNGASRGDTAMSPDSLVEPSDRTISSPPSPPVDFQKAKQVWNEMAKANGLPVASEITGKRKREMLKRFKEHDGLNSWRGVVSHVPRCQWLLGKKPGSSWRCNIDFVLRQDRFLPMLEGAYDDPDPAAPKFRPL